VPHLAVRSHVAADAGGNRAAVLPALRRRVSAGIVARGGTARTCPNILERPRLLPARAPSACRRAGRGCPAWRTISDGCVDACNVARDWTVDRRRDSGVCEPRTA